MKFGYYANFWTPDNYSVDEYGYLIKGSLDGDFMGAFIPAMAGARASVLVFRCVYSIRN